MILLYHILLLQYDICLENDIENTTELKVASHPQLHPAPRLRQASRSTQSDSLLQRHKAKGPRVLGKPCFSSASHGINTASTWHQPSPTASTSQGGYSKGNALSNLGGAGERPQRIRLFKFKRPKHRISTDSDKQTERLISDEHLTTAPALS